MQCVSNGVCFWPVLQATHWVFLPAFFAGKLRLIKLSDTTFSSQNGGVVGKICPI